VTNDGSRDLNGSKYVVAWQICKEILKKSFDNLIVFHNIIYQDKLWCNFFIVTKRSC
jgi:hypothetical protein